MYEGPAKKFHNVIGKGHVDDILTLTDHGKT